MSVTWNKVVGTGETKRRPTSAERHGVEGLDKWVVTPQMRFDPTFMLDPKNAEKIREAAKSNRFV